MSGRLSKSEALELLKKCPDNVIEHCKAVSAYAVELAEKIRENGYTVDVEFVETAALLHDIGRSKTHDIHHGIEGATILNNYPLYARVCECHIGGGLTMDDAKSLDLPKKDYLPESLEEKIITHADNMVEGTIVVGKPRFIKRLSDRLGPDHPALGRVKALADEIGGYLAGSI